MKQEHRFVAEVFSLIRPFIDMAHPFYISLDGFAAAKGVRAGTLMDADVPDLYFRKIGRPSHLAFEAKIWDGVGRLSIRRTQRDKWKTVGTGVYKPTGWIAANVALNDFRYWPHASILPKLDSSRQRGKNVYLHMPRGNGTMNFTSIHDLVVHLLSI